jgi:hypothetical protein
VYGEVELTPYHYWGLDLRLLEEVVNLGRGAIVVLVMRANDLEGEWPFAPTTIAGLVGG